MSNNYHDDDELNEEQYEEQNTSHGNSSNISGKARDAKDFYQKHFSAAKDKAKNYNDTVSAKQAIRGIKEQAKNISPGSIKQGIKDFDSMTSPKAMANHMKDKANSLKENLTPENIKAGLNSYNNLGRDVGKNLVNNAKELPKKVVDNAKQLNELTSPKNMMGQAKKFSNDLRSKYDPQAAKDALSSYNNLGKDAIRGVAGKLGKEGAKEGAKMAAKEGAKQVATKAATDAGLAATGVGAPIAAAKAALEAAALAAKKIGKKIRDNARKNSGKEPLTPEQEKERKKKRRLIIIIILVAFIFMPAFTAGTLYVMSNEMTNSLENIIRTREKRYDKMLMLFNEEQYKDTAFKDYPDENDYSFKTYIESLKDITNTLVSQDDLTEAAEQGKTEYDIAAENAQKYMEAEKENFNKINWRSTNTQMTYSAGGMNGAVLEENDQKPTRSGDLNIVDIPDSDMIEVPDSKIKIPSFTANTGTMKYEINQSIPNDTDENLKQKAMTYVNMVSPEYASESDSTSVFKTTPYLQKWIIPYAVAIATQDKKFVTEKLMNDMYSDVDITLYQINRDTKNTTRNYYLTTERYKVWDVYHVVVTETENEDGSTTTHVSSSLTEKDHKELIDVSNTKVQKVGTYDSGAYDGYLRGSSDDYYEARNSRKEVVLKKSGGKAIIATAGEGVPIIASTYIERNIAPVKYIPKLTYAETFYNILKNEYTIKAIDENTVPKTSMVGELVVVSDTAETGSILTTETWDEDLIASKSEIKDYKVSYLNDEDLKKMGRKVSRIEWVQDAGKYSKAYQYNKNPDENDGDNNGATSDTSEYEEGVEAGNTEFEFTWEGMIKKAFDMASKKKISYSQDSRQVVNTYKDIAKLDSIQYEDCSAFVTSMYKVFLNINVGGTSSNIHTFGKNGNISNGYKAVLSPIGSMQNLKPGDILWRKGHVGLYVGTNRDGIQMQIDHGSGMGPKYRAVSTNYTHYIRYIKVDGEEDNIDDNEIPDEIIGEAGSETPGGNLDPNDPHADFYADGPTFPIKTDSELLSAYIKYGNSRGYSYQDLEFAFIEIDRYYSGENYGNSGSNMGTVSGLPGFGWPVEITDSHPGTADVLQLFGNTAKYPYGFHAGVDISNGTNLEYSGSLTKGPNILAAHSGTVIAARGTTTTDTVSISNPTPNNFVQIQTDDEQYTTFYGHLSEVDVSVGDTVTKGQKIGRMGTTGYSEGVHLHFEIIDASGSKVDPLNYYIMDPSYDQTEETKLSYTGTPLYRFSAEKGFSVSSFNLGYRLQTGDVANYNKTMQYFDIIKKWCDIYGIDPYLVVALICQESGGNPNIEKAAIGIMQWEKTNGTSLSVKRLDGTTETISFTLDQLRKDVDLQIHVGCAELRNRLVQAGDIPLALQGYNFGPGYVTWAKKNYGGYSKENAAEFSDMQAQKLGWERYGDKEYVEHVLGYYNTEMGMPYMIDESGNKQYLAMATGGADFTGIADTLTSTAGTFPIFTQGDPKWGSVKFSTGTLSSSACGPTAFANLLSGLGWVLPGYDGATLNGYTGKQDGIMEPAEVAKFSLDRGGHAAGQGMNHSFPATVAKVFGKQVVTLGNGSPNSADANTVLNYLNQGYVGVCSASSGFFTGGGHIIAVVGTDGQGRIGIVDTKRTGFYTPAQLNTPGGMPDNPAKRVNRSANIKLWWLFKVN